jgi:uncharacterized protein
MKLVLALIAASILNGADMTGHYYLRGVMEVGSELLLRPNGTFEFMLSYGASDYWGRGTWKAADEAVVLTSEESKHKAPFTLVKSEAGKSGETRIKLIGEDGRIVPNVDLFFLVLVPGSKSVQGRTDFDGEAVFPSSSERRAIIWDVGVYDYRSPRFELPPDMHTFTFQIDGAAMSEWVFKEERLRIENGALIMKRSPEMPDMRYVK